MASGRGLGIGCMWTLLFKISTSVCKTLRPLRTRAPVLAVFGISQKLQGFSLRHRLLMGANAENLIALNARHCANEVPESQGRPGQLANIPCYKGFKVKPIWNPEIHINI